MATVIVKTNASQATDVLIEDLGVQIPNSGGQDTFDELREILALQQSEDLRALLTDDAYGAGSSTLILNDGASDIAQADAEAFLFKAILEFGSSSNFGVVQTNASGEVDEDLTFDGTAEVNNLTLGNDMDAGGFSVTNMADGINPSDAVTLQQLQDQAASNKIWKELVLTCNQFDSTNDALSQAGAFYLDGQPTSGDTFILTDGSTTRTYGFGSGGDVTVTIGADADETMTNLASSITGDGSGLWDAEKVTSLQSVNDGSGSSTAGHVLVVWRRNQSSASFDDRMYGSLTTPANGQYINYNGELDYSSITSSQLPSSDPGQKEFGFGRDTASLTSNETHVCLDEDLSYLWDSDGESWQVVGAGGIVAGDGLTKTSNTLDVGAGAGIIVNTDDIEVDFGEVGDIASLGSTASAGALDESARADHVHTHGDRGGDGAGSQHDADQIDVEGTFNTIGAPGNAESVFSNIENLFNGGAKAGKFLAFGSDQKVPGSGTLFLETAGGVVSSSAGYAMLRAGTITGASFSLDQTESANTYNVSIRVNGTEQETLAIGTGVTTGQATNFTATYAAGDTVEVALERQTGSGSSDYDDVVVLVEVVDD